MHVKPRRIGLRLEKNNAQSSILILIISYTVIALVA